MPAIAHTAAYAEEKRTWAGWITAVMERAGLNGAQFAAEIGVSKMSVSAWRNPKNNARPTPTMQEKMIAYARSKGLVA